MSERRLNVRMKWLARPSQFSVNYNTQHFTLNTYSNTWQVVEAVVVVEIIVGCIFTV